MNSPVVKPTTSGAAFRVTIIGPQQAEAYENVYAILDSEFGVVHVLSADRTIHYLTIPITSALVEWEDPAALGAQPRMPPFGPGAFQRLGEQVQRMAEGMGNAFGPG